MSETGTLRTTQFNSKECYEIGEINFYIPAKLAEKRQVFIVMKNARNLYEIVELSKSKVPLTNSTTKLYKVPINQALRINNEKIKLKLMLLNTSDEEYLYSQELDIIISTNNYQLARQVYIAQEAGQKIQDLYMKIVGLTEENRKIYKELREGEKS